MATEPEVWSFDVDDPRFFRLGYGRLVAALSRRVGALQLAAVEDAVQSALVAALETWPRVGAPANPLGWLYRAAVRNLLGTIRQDARRRDLLDRLGPASAGEWVGLQREAEDLLPLLFACCDPELPEVSGLILALNTLCGFAAPELAGRLFTTEANVYQRLSRARRRLRASGETALREPNVDRTRLPQVHRVLYVMFTEGHLSLRADAALRRDVCDDALRLTNLLATHRVATAETWALAALMHLHAARMAAREAHAQSETDGLRLLAEQDRASWDRRHIAEGLAWLAKSAEGESLSRYHAEAGIAAEHCLAPSLADTNWDRVIACYDLLLDLSPSPLARLNRAVAVAERDGPAAGLAALDGMHAPAWLRSSYMWGAVLADLHRRCGNADQAQTYRAAALEAAPSAAVRASLERRLG